MRTILTAILLGCCAGASFSADFDKDAQEAEARIREARRQRTLDAIRGGPSKPLPRITKIGLVVKQRIAIGSKSERDAIMLQVPHPAEQYELLGPGKGVWDDDPVAESWVGKYMSCEGTLSGPVLREADCKPYSGMLQHPGGGKVFVVSDGKVVGQQG